VTWLIGLALKAGIPLRFAKGAVIGILIVALVVGLGVGKCAYDKSIIEEHDAEREATIAKDDKKADNNAAVQRRVDDARVTSEKEEIKDAIAEAQATGSDPRAAYYHCIALQQQARKRGQPSPNC
jgi:hypothetical protein